MHTRKALQFAVLLVLFGAWPSLGVPHQKKEQEKREEGSRTGYYEKWLKEDVIYIITAEERKAFKDLRTDQERETFIEQFWARRDSDPRTSENEFKQEHYQRIIHANEEFACGIPGWKTDRGRIYIIFGPPDEVDSHPSGRAGGRDTDAFPFERWRYRHIDGIGDDIEIEFVDTTRSGEYKIVPKPGKA